jgi:transcriptional regulator GlxA family with amidase domain
VQIAILTYDGFNEIDSFVALNILNRLKRPGWQAHIVAPSERVTSMNGVTITSQKPYAFANEADAVLIGSGRRTREVIKDDALMNALRLDPSRQLIGSQCSGALIMQRLGFLQELPACTDGNTRPTLEALGVRVLEQPFAVIGNLATAGGCLSSQYLASWLILRTFGEEAVAEALSYVAPIGEETELVARTLGVLRKGIVEVSAAV